MTNTPSPAPMHFCKPCQKITFCCKRIKPDSIKSSKDGWVYYCSECLCGYNDTFDSPFLNHNPFLDESEDDGLFTWEDYEN